MSTVPSKVKKMKRQRRQGAAAVEFAVIAPLFLLLLAGIVEFGQVFRIEHALSTASRRGARSAMLVGAETSAIQQNINDLVVTLIGVEPQDVSVAVAVNGQEGVNVSDAEQGDEICVTVSVPYSEAGLGFFATFFSDATLSSNCLFEHE